jgi:hypothetical protein
MMPRFVALGCGETRAKSLRRPREQLQPEHVGIELAGDAADFEGLRDELRSRSRAPAKISKIAQGSQADIASGDANAEHL